MADGESRMNLLIQMGVAAGIVALCVLGLGLALNRRNRRHGACSCKGISGERSSCSYAPPEH
jgi:hypothetical protein